MNAPAFKSSFFRVDLDSWCVLRASRWAQEILFRRDWPYARLAGFHLRPRGFAATLVGQCSHVARPATDDQESVCTAPLLPSSTYSRPSATPFML